MEYQACDHDIGSRGRCGNRGTEPMARYLDDRDER